MTDSRHDPVGRIDLRPLDVDADPAREDAVVATALARLPRRENDIMPLLLLRRRLALAAAVLAAVAAASLLMTQARGADSGESLLQSWAQSGHVPTNAELLTVYYGYQP
jgi:hypothetical protein